MNSPLLSPVDLEALATMLAARVADQLSRQQRLVDRVELSKRIGVSVPTIERLLKANKIPRVLIGRRVLFDVEAVIDSLKDGVA